MKITLLGTGTSQGVPVIGCQCKVCQSHTDKDKRLRTSAMIEWDNHRFVIDCGPDFRTQMLRKKVDHLDGILLTHEHADHTAGLDDIRPLYFKNKKPLPVYALPRVIDNLTKRFDYIFTNENRYPGAPEVAPKILHSGTKFNLFDLEVTPLKILHGNLPILGYKFNNFAYITDAKIIPEMSLNAIKNIDLLIINALHKKPHKMHMNLEEALKLIANVKPQKAVLTHISHHMGLYEQVASSLPNNIVLGYDGMEIQL